MYSKLINNSITPTGLELSPKKLTIYILVAIGLTPVIKVCVNLVHLIQRRLRDAKILKDFPGPPPHWFYGNARDSPPGKAIYKRLDWVKTYGDAYTVHLGVNHRQVLLGSARAVQSVMNTPEPKGMVYAFLIPWIGDGLLVSSGTKWTRNRKLLSPAFHFDILKPYQTLFSQSANTLLQKWEELLRDNPDEPIEMFQHVSLLTLDSLMKCIFGINRDFQNLAEKDPYVNKILEITALISQRFIYPPHHNDTIYYFSYNGYKFRKACDFVHAYSKSVIEKKRQELASKRFVNGLNTPLQSRYVDFIDVLLTCHDGKGNGLCDQDIEAEVDTFMFEGHDTTASGISWCLYNLAKHPEYQEKCRKEVIDVLGDRDEVTWNDLTGLNYLTMCIKESLRLTPPVPVVSRKITQPITLYDGRVLPAGITAVLNIYCVHMNPDDWRNPDEYEPDRFTLDASQNRHPYAFIPFSAGPRNCIGQNFAMNEMKTAMALILKKFRFSLVEGRDPADPIQSLVLRAQKGIFLKLETVH